MRRDRAQTRPGGMLWAFVVFVGILFAGAALWVTVIEQGVIPLHTYAEGMQWSSSHSTTGLSAFDDWIALFPAIVLIAAAAWFISYAFFARRARL